MKVDQDNSDLMMTEAIQFDPAFKIEENKTQCLSLCCTSQDILLATFSDGFTLVGKREGADFRGFKLAVTEEPSFNSSPLKAQWTRFGEHIVGLRELALISPKNARGELRLYLSGFSRRIGQNP